MDSGLLPKGTQNAQLGRGLGQVGTGIVHTVVGVKGAVVGGGLTATGGGALVGVPLCIGGVTLATNGVITFCNGVKEVALVLCRWEDDPVAIAAATAPGPSAGSSPPPQSAGQTPAAKPAANPTGQTPATKPPTNSTPVTKTNTAKGAPAQSSPPVKPKASDAPAATSGGRAATDAAKGGVNWSWKSTKTFGHTFKTHGSGAENFKRLLDRSRTRGQSPQQGQWLDNEKAAEFLQSLRVNGPSTVRIPSGLGQVIHSDGTVSAAQWARVVPNSDGGFTSAFPIVP